MHRISNVKNVTFYDCREACGNTCFIPQSFITRNTQFSSFGLFFNAINAVQYDLISATMFQRFGQNLSMPRLVSQMFCDRLMKSLRLSNRFPICRFGKQHNFSTSLPFEIGRPNIFIAVRPVIHSESAAFAVMFTINAGFGCQAWLHSMSKDDMSKDDRKMSPMYVTLKAGVIHALHQMMIAFNESLRWFSNPT